MKYFKILILLIATTSSGFSQTNQSKLSIKQVVIDTDAYNEIDDQFAIVYSMFSPDELDVQAIYAAPFHNSRSSGPKDGMEKSYDEILNVLKLINRSEFKDVYKGSDRFMQDAKIPIESPAVNDLIERALSAKDKLYVLALGAPTNVASAIVKEPRIKDKIIVVWLGGKGLSWDTAREFNLRQDLIASQILFQEGVDLVQVPTEPVTSHLIVTSYELDAHLKGKNEISDYLVKIFRSYTDDHFGWSKEIWDISVIAYVINEQWMKIDARPMPVLTDQMTYKFDKTRSDYKVVTHINRNKVFADMYYKLINFPKKK